MVLFCKKRDLIFLLYSFRWVVPVISVWGPRLPRLSLFPSHNILLQVTVRRTAGNTLSVRRDVVRFARMLVSRQCGRTSVDVALGTNGPEGSGGVAAWSAVGAHESIRIDRWSDEQDPDKSSARIVLFHIQCIPEPVSVGICIPPWAVGCTVRQRFRSFVELDQTLARAHRLARPHRRSVGTHGN